MSDHAGSGRTLTALGYRLLLVALLVSSLRVALSHKWLPASFWGVISFLASDLLLLPLSLLLVIGGHAYRACERPRMPAPGPTTDTFPWRGPSPLLFGIGALLCALCAVSLAYPRLATHLEWGRYGFPPPVVIVTPEAITAETGIWFPDGAVVAAGEMKAAPPQTYMVAMIAIPRHEVDVFLTQPALQISEARLVDNRYAAIVDWDWNPDSAEHVRSAVGAALPPSLYCAVLVDVDDPDEATVYLYCEDSTGGNW